MIKIAFNQNKYITQWQKENTGTVTAKYNKAFVSEFKQACKDLNIKQSDVIRKAMNETIEQASKIKK